MREIWPTGNRACLPDKKQQKFRMDLQVSLSSDRSQNLPGPAADIVLRVFQISSRSIHFQRCYRRMREHRQNAP